MKTLRVLPLVAASLLLAGTPRPIPAHAPPGHAEGAHHPPEGGGGEAMKAQHERMERFREASRALTDALVRSDARGALGGSAALLGALAGHEKDVPHKNAAKAREFHALFAQLGKRTGQMKKELDRGDLQAAAVSYGRILSVCVSCHRTFRD